MNKELELYAKLVLFLMIIDFVWIFNAKQFQFSFFYLFILGILSILSTFVSYKYLLAKKLSLYYLILIPFLLPIGMLIILIKKGENRIEPF